MTTENNNNDGQQAQSLAAQKAESLREQRKPDPTKRELIKQHNDSYEEIMRSLMENRQRMMMLSKQQEQLDNMMAAVFEKELGLSPAEVNDLLEEFLEEAEEEQQAEADDDDVEGSVGLDEDDIDVSNLEGDNDD